MTTTEIDELEPEVADDGEYTLDGGGGEAEGQAAAPAASEPAAGAAPEPPTLEGLQAQLAALQKERDHYKGAASANWMRFKDLRESLHAQQQPPGQQPAAQAKPAEEEKPPEYDPENPVPYLRWRQDQTAKSVEQLQQMILLQHQQQVEREQQRVIAEVDQRGAQLISQAVQGDPEFDSAMKYVAGKALELERQRQPTDEEAQAAVLEHNFLWFRQQILQGRNPVEDMKAHARTIGWQPPPASPVPAAPTPRLAAARKPDPFRRPVTPKASGANGKPRITDFGSEDEMFAALDSGALTDADLAQQLAVVLPAVQ